MANKLVFSTDDLPSGLDEHGRRALWRDLFAQTLFTADMSLLPDPLSVRFEFTPTGAVGVFKYEGTIESLARKTPRHASTGQPEIFHLGFNAGSSPYFYDIKSKEAVMRSGDMMLFDPDGRYVSSTNGVNSWQGLHVSKQKLLEFVPGAEDMTLMRLPDTNAGRLFRRYIEMICSTDGLNEDPTLTSHVETTLLDLAALTLGTSRDVAEMARMRGVRAARAQEIVACIRAGFSDPSFSPRQVAQKIGLSTRYINEILAETGMNFTDRMNELRLDKARRMLASSRCGQVKISDIALACGFNEVSYFNRCFRRRFGASPTQYRGGNSD